MKENIKITIVQSDIIWENKTANLIKYDNVLSKITEETDLIVLPEMFSTGFLMNPEKFSENTEGEAFTWLKNKSVEKNCVITGSIITKDNNKYYNRLIWFEPNGNSDFYDKRHLFSFAGEDKHYTSGNKLLIKEIKSWKIRPLICYDLRFPVWSRNRNNYDILIYIANWPERRKDAWSTLLKARAIENQCFVVGVNRIGIDGSGINHSGDSVVLDYFGKELSSIKPFEESYQTIEISYKELYDFRQKFNTYQDSDNFEIKL